MCGNCGGRLNMLNRWALMSLVARFFVLLSLGLVTVPGFGSIECAERILIVNPWSSAHLLVRELETRGMEAHSLLSMDVPDWAKATFKVSPLRLIDARDRPWNEALGDVRELDPSHIILGADSDGLYLTDFLTDQMQLPGNPARSSAARRRKMETQNLYRDAGRPYIRSVITSDVEEAVELALQTGYPIYLKPNDDGGGSHNFEVHSEEELRRDFSKMLGERNFSTGRNIEEVLVGEFIPGREFAVQGVVYKGRTFISSIVEYDKVRLPGRGRLYQSEWIISPDSPEAKQMIAFVLDGNKLLDMRHGAFHWEVKVDSRSGLAVPMELNARLAGSSLPEFFKDCLGYSDVQILADIFQDPDLLEARPSLYSIPAGGNGLRFIVRTPAAGLNFNRTTLAALSDHPAFLRARVLLGGLDNLPESVDLDSVPVILEYMFWSESEREAFRQKLISIQEQGKFFY